MAAAAAEPRHADALAHVRRGDAGAQRLDGGHDLVAGHQRQARQRQLAVDDVQVGAAHRAGTHAQQHLAGARRGRVARHHRQRRARTACKVIASKTVSGGWAPLGIVAAARGPLLQAGVKRRRPRRQPPSRPGAPGGCRRGGRRDAASAPRRPSADANARRSAADACGVARADAGDERHAHHRARGVGAGRQARHQQHAAGAVVGRQRKDQPAADAQGVEPRGQRMRGAGVHVDHVAGRQRRHRARHRTHAGPAATASDWPRRAPRGRPRSRRRSRGPPGPPAAPGSRCSSPGPRPRAARCRRARGSQAARQRACSDGWPLLMPRSAVEADQHVLVQLDRIVAPGRARARVPSSGHGGGPTKSSRAVSAKASRSRCVSPPMPCIRRSA